MALGSGFSFMWASDKSVTSLSELSSIARSSITFAGAAVFTTISFTIFFTLGLIEIPNFLTSDQLLSLIIYSVISMAISQVFFLAAIDKVGVAISSLHLNFSPFSGTKAVIQYLSVIPIHPLFASLTIFFSSISS